MSTANKENNPLYKNTNRTFDEVVVTYIHFLQVIGVETLRDNKNTEVNKRKFCAVRKELHEFLIKHQNFFRFKKASLYLNDNSLVYSVDIDVSKSCEDFINLDDFLQSVEKIIELVESKTVFYKKFCWDVDHKEIFKRIKLQLNKDVVEDADVKCFLKNHFLVDNIGIKTKCSNYIDLRNYTNERVENYCNSQVSSKRIDELSFNFDESIKISESKLSCDICFDDFENGQEVCQLPCNHLLCRDCAGKWFEIPKNGSDAYYQCPFCRDDCT